MRAKRSEAAPVAAFLKRVQERRRSVWKAAVFLSGCCLLALLLGGCGDDREERAKTLTQRGYDAIKERRPDAAREYFGRALFLRPQYASANYGMARVLDQYDCDTAGALVYYRRYLDLAEEGTARNAAAAALKTLELVEGGKLEDPVAATEDVLGAAYAGKRAAFFERLAGSLLHARAAEGKGVERLLTELGAYSLGGRPEVVYRKITPDLQGAVVVVRLRSEAESAAEYACLLLVRGTGDYANLWQLSNARRMSAPGKTL